MNLKGILTTNVEMKLLSFLLASLIWLVGAFEAVDEVEMPLSVSYVNIPVGLAVKRTDEAGGMIRIEGPRILLLRQKLKGVSLRLDLAGAKEGWQELTGLENKVKLVQGVKMIRLFPLKVELYR